MQRGQQCPNCRKIISSSRFNIHVVKCTSLSLSRSNSSILSQSSGHQSEIFSTHSKVKHSQRKIFEEKPVKSNADFKKTQSCIFCLEKFPISEIQEHMASCEHKLISCEHCRDMFPQPLMPDHRQVCRGMHPQRVKYPRQGWNELEYQMMRMTPQMYEEVEESTDRSGVITLLGNLGKLGGKLLEKGLTFGGKALEYCQRVIESRRQQTLENLQRVQGRLVQLLQNAIYIYIEEGNMENGGMDREQINRIEKIKYMKTNKNNEQPDICTICYCELQTDDVLLKLKCKHFYHEDCISKWLQINSHCPVCKNDQRGFRRLNR